MREQSLLVSCPHCKTKYHIPPELLGQKTECPRCAKQFTMELAEKEQPERPGKASLPPRMTVPEPPPSRPSLVIVSCHSCGVKYEIPAEFLGDSAECSECGDIFTLTEDPENLSDNTEVIAAKAELDAVSGATPATGTQNYVWDCTGADGKTVPPGRYRIFVEGTLYWKSRVLYTANITLGKEPSTVRAMPQYSVKSSSHSSMLGTVSVACKP